MDKVEFGRKLKSVRKDKGYSTSKLADLCDLDVVFIRHLESGDRGISTDTLIKFCNIFDVPPSYFLEADLEVTSNYSDIQTRVVAYLNRLSPRKLERAYIILTAAFED